MATNKEESLEAKVFRNNYAIMGKAVKDHLADLAPEFYAKDVITADIRDSLLKQHAPNTLLTAIESKIATGETTTFKTTMEIFASNNGTKHIVEPMKHNLQVLIDQNRQTPDDSALVVPSFKFLPIRSLPHDQRPQTSQQLPSAQTPIDDFRRLQIQGGVATPQLGSCAVVPFPVSEKSVQSSDEMVGSKPLVTATQSPMSPLTDEQLAVINQLIDQRLDQHTEQLDASYQRQIKILDNKIANKDAEVKNISSTLATVVKKCEQLEKEKNRLCDVEERNECLQKRNVQVEEENKHLKRKLKDIVDELDTTKTQGRDMRCKIKQLEEDKKTLQGERSCLQEQFNDAEIKQKLQKYSTET